MKLWGCKVFTGTAGETIEFGEVEFFEGKITRVSALPKDSPIPIFDSQTIDARGKFAMPGMIDCECHLVQDAGPSAFTRIWNGTLTESMFNTMRSAERYLRRGFTTVRDCGDKQYETVFLRDKIQEGKAPGPRIICCGMFIRVTKGHATGWEVDGPYSARQAARENMSHNIDWVKIIVESSSLIKSQYEAGALQMLPDEIEAICTVAHNYGKEVAAHIHTERGIISALTHGVKTIEHCTALTPTVVDLLEEKKAYGITTFTPYARMAVDTSGITSPGMHAYCDRVMETKIRYFGDAVKKDANLAFGTDAGAPLTYHGDSGYELACIMKYGGIDAERALELCTTKAAKALAIDDTLGKLQPGYIADIKVINGDPTQDIYVCDDVSFVFKEGELVCKDNQVLDVNTKELWDRRILMDVTKPIPERA